MPQVAAMQNGTDMAERRRVLDAGHSFIVQAPAGSGKTGLLIQRYLTLLACVDEPEEIIAITFTRKAAAEMRERIVTALTQAANSASSQNSETGHERLTRELANAALRRDTLSGWHILENPVRLRVQTFDSLCASLTRQMPLLSNLGSSLQSVEDASDLYLEAARAAIGMIETSHDVAKDIERLLEHLDNDAARLEKLLAAMLARRDHWLRHIHGRGRDELEAALRNTRSALLKQVRGLCALLPQGIQAELIGVTRYAANNLAKNSDDPAAAGYSRFHEMKALPGDEEQDVACWQAIVELVLTKCGKWRKCHTI
jgi:ATP-dependent exoDNAse (exonuclease V) beta subunit